MRNDGEFTRNRSKSCADERACESVAYVVLFFRGSWDAQASMVVESQDSNSKVDDDPTQIALLALPVGNTIVCL